MQTVTPRQLEILRYIRDYRSRHGYSPTMQEIGDQVGLTKVTVFEHVGALERKGLLIRGAKHKARSLRVSERFEFPHDPPAGLPLVGRIAAGAPIEAIENPEALDLEGMFDRGDGTFALEVTGDSMTDEHIRDGDYVVCRKTATARNGEVVVALIDNNEATLKTFYREAGRIRLQPANEEMEPIYVDPEDVEIQGKVIGIIRKL
ncbi:MAG: transcriptional repressor LexA [Phycisphaerae bacterium]|nr:transcriptional repressor LexA [Phycisphaerae bacterium]